MSINKLWLTPTEFTEEVVAVVKPEQASPWSAGLHTLSAVGDLTLIDGKRMVFTGQELHKRLSRGLIAAGGRIVRRKAKRKKRR